MDGKNYKAEIIPDQRTKVEFFVKVVVAGDCEVGKTAILKQLLKKEFISEYKPTKGYEFNIVLIKVNDTVIKFQIWDMCGAENYRTSLLQLYRNSNLGVLVYSISSRKSFDNIEDWIVKLKKKAPTTKIILIGNKKDEEDKREVTYEEGKQICEKHNLEFFEEISATEEFTSPNWMERGAICVFKDYESGGNDISAGAFNASVMLDPKDINQPKKKNCC